MPLFACREKISDDEDACKPMRFVSEWKGSGVRMGWRLLAVGRVDEWFRDRIKGGMEERRRGRVW